MNRQDFDKLLSPLFDEYFARHCDEYGQMSLCKMNECYNTFKINMDKLLNLKPGEEALTAIKNEKRLITSKQWQAMEDWGFERVNNYGCTFEGTQSDAFMLYWILHELHLQDHIELKYEDGEISIRSLQLKTEEA